MGLFVVMHIRITRPASATIEHGDKVIHFGLYLMLVVLGTRHLRARVGGVSLAALLAWAVVYAAYGALDEWLQQFVDRSMSFHDWLADFAGVIVATVAAFVTGRSRSKAAEL